VYIEKIGHVANVGNKKCMKLALPEASGQMGMAAERRKAWIVNISALMLTSHSTTTLNVIMSAARFAPPTLFVPEYYLVSIFWSLIIAGSGFGDMPDGPRIFSCYPKHFTERSKQEMWLLPDKAR
jgi:hypothetical protein